MASNSCTVILEDNGAHALLGTSNNEKKAKSDRARCPKNSDEQLSAKDMDIVQAMHPLYVSMAFYGMHWTGKSNWFSKKRCPLDLFTLHCCFTLSLVWIWLLSSFTGYQNENSFVKWLLKHLFSQIFGLQAAFGITGSILQRHKYIPTSYKLWNNYRLNHGGIPFHFIKKRVLRWVVAINVILLIIITMDILFLVTVVEGPAEDVHPLSSLLKRHFPDVPTTYFMVPLMIAMNYLSMGWLQSIIFITQTNYLLKREFKHLTNELANAIKSIADNCRTENQEEINSHQNDVTVGAKRDVTGMNVVEQYRKRHLELCRLVNHFDDASSLFVIFLYFFNIPLIVFSIYGLLGFGRTTKYDSSIMTWYYVEGTAYFIIMLLTVTISSSRLAAAVSMTEGKREIV